MKGKMCLWMGIIFFCEGKDIYEGEGIFMKDKI